jgi:hypothetical protein
MAVENEMFAHAADGGDFDCVIAADFGPFEGGVHVERAEKNRVDTYFHNRMSL